MGSLLPCPGHSESHHQTFYLFHFRYIKALETGSPSLHTHFPLHNLLLLEGPGEKFFFDFRAPKHWLLLHGGSVFNPMSTLDLVAH